MAKFIPSLEEIKNNKMEKPTEGEWVLLQKLQDLSDNYTIYFQPYINIAHPDIVIVAKECGVMIIEVKDWNLGAYEFLAESNSFGTIQEKRGHNRVRNPFEQVQSYKDELYNLFCPALFLGKMENKKVYGVICSSIFYYKATEIEIKTFFKQNKNEWNYITFWGADSKYIVNDIKRRLRKNVFFTNEIYWQISALFKPSLERIEQAKPFCLSEEQKKFTISESNKRQKIKGVAGSGKTLVLAQRAVNCFQRTKTPVLIIIFNITLQYYIRDKIAQITRDFTSNQRKQFHIIPIFDFVKQMLELNGIDYKKEYRVPPKELIRLRFDTLKKNKDKIFVKYRTILIDEVQDFEYEWLDRIEKLFLYKQGEFVLFGDEKQNIYNLELDKNSLPRTKIQGPWLKLKESYRLTKRNAEIALQFQKEFFSKKYEEIDVKYIQISIFDLFIKQETRYYDISHFNSEQLGREITEIVECFRTEEKAVSPNDICILSSKYEILREIEFIFRNEKQMKTTTICETKEEYNKICELEPNLERQREELEKFRRMKKYAFQMNEGVMKLCTIHSFKGWEMNTIFLILGEKDDRENNDELIYTAITRAKKNLVIINYKNNRYKNFFEKNIGIFYTNE